MLGTHPASEFYRTEFLRLTVPAQAAGLAPLRRQLRRCLAPLPISAHRKDELLLAVSEATANCVDHAYDDRPRRRAPFAPHPRTTPAAQILARAAAGL